MGLAFKYFMKANPKKLIGTTCPARCSTSAGISTMTGRYCRFWISPRGRPTGKQSATMQISGSSLPRRIPQSVKLIPPTKDPVGGEAPSFAN